MRAGFGVHDEVVQAAPRRLQALELLMMHDFIELRADQVVQIGDAILNPLRDVEIGRIGLLNDAVDKFLDQAPGGPASLGIGIPHEPAFVENPV